MKKKSQKKPQQERELNILLAVLILLVFGTRLVYTNISVGLTMLSFVTFCLYLAGILIAASPAILKNIRPLIDKTTNRWWIVPAFLWTVHSVYALVVADQPWLHLVLGLIYAGAMLLFVYKTPSPNLNWISILLALVLWVPVQTGLIPAVGIPPREWITGLYYLTALLSLLYIFIIVKNADIGFSLRLKGEHFKLVFSGVFILFVIFVSTGFLTQTVSLTRYSPSGHAIFVRIIALILIVLPQEFVFRGIVLNGLHRMMGEQKYSIALVISAVLFALSHYFPMAVSHLYTFPEYLVLSGNIWIHASLMFVCGLFLGWIYLKTKQVFASVLVHFLIFWIWITFFTTG
ncbi:CPBP family intramembrane metalloprotease [candidate division KSB1 bacterium]|nr:CPBP family intramembrane metalloprotease [candidate division KSB1 bacterium]